MIDKTGKIEQKSQNQTSRPSKRKYELVFGAFSVFPQKIGRRLGSWKEVCYAFCFGGRVVGCVLFLFLFVFVFFFLFFFFCFCLG
jgi:hypothetical protein